MHFKLFTLAIGIILILISCKSKPEQNSDENLDPNIHKVVVEEVLQTKTYTYLRVTEKDTESWLAIAKKQVKEDDILYYEGGLKMTGFVSKELNKTFENIYFVDKISDRPALKSENQLTNSPGANKQTKQIEGLSIQPEKDGITIAELFSKKDSYSGQTVTIKGQVIKYNSQIMGKNWVHIQDGTNNKDNYDLTLTTNEVVKIGDVVTFEGVISLNKDFGAGYSYEIIMENAKRH